MSRLALVCALLNACSWSPRHAARDTLSVVPMSGNGYSIQIVPESQVHVNDGVLGVDTPDGFRWMEARWLAGPVAPAVVEWGMGQCDGLVWERSAVPIEGVHTQNGMCTRNGEEFWTFLVLETRGERTLMTTWLAHREAIPYEDAWVEFTGTALTLSGANTPVMLVEQTPLRRLIRETAVTSTGSSPVPGGGELGAAISEQLTDLWTARAAQPLPAWD